ncbi:hypothetical protein Tco_0491566 [Tanacetum coccineum]
MKLNPKNALRNPGRNGFLGYKVSTNGLRACPDKADAVLSLPSPRCIKDVQKLNGKLAKKAADTSIFRKPNSTRPEYNNTLWKSVVSLAQCKQTIEKILPSTHGRCNNKSTDKATVVKFGNIWKNAEVEVRARRIRHPIQTKDRNQRPNIGGFYCGRLKEESPDELMAEPEVLPASDVCTQTAHLLRRLRAVSDTNKSEGQNF